MDESELLSLSSRLKILEEHYADHDHRFDTLQTPIWKKIVFKIDGWPGQRNLNADAPKWRPWRRWWTS